MQIRYKTIYYQITQLILLFVFSYYFSVEWGGHKYNRFTSNNVTLLIYLRVLFVNYYFLCNWVLNSITKLSMVLNSQHVDHNDGRYKTKKNNVKLMLEIRITSIYNEQYQYF